MSTQSPTMEPVPAIPFFVISIIWIIGIFMLVIFCFWAHKTKYTAKYHHDTVKQLAAVYEKIKNSTDEDAKKSLPEVYRKLREVSENSSVYMDMYEGIMEPLSTNEVMTTVDHTMFHNPVGRTCVVAGSKMIDQIVNSLAWAFGSVLASSGMFFAQQFTDYQNEAVTILLISIGLMFFGAVMLQAAQNQCFQDKMNGDYGMFEKNV
jgi:Na+/melibiose symporter-like transporter